MDMFSVTVKKSPVAYFLEKVGNGNSLWNTTTLGDEKGRERVYDTIFRLPWRCELLIDVGFFVCFNSFLSLLTVMPTRVVMIVWKLLKTRKFKRLSPVELSDFGYFIIMACGITVLQQIDISFIYHIIRGQATIKLYVIYNVLEVFDKLCQIFNGDVLQMLFYSAEELGRCPSETRSMRLCIWRFISDQILAVVTTIVHSFILLAQAITLSACIVAHYNALPALLVSNNFSEIKSYVFKGYKKDNIHSMVYFAFDSSLSLLQAFAICIALVDSKMPCELSGTRKSQTEELKAFGKLEDIPTSYVSNPPVSPVGNFSLPLASLLFKPSCVFEGLESPADGRRSSESSYRIGDNGTLEGTN
ncbi:unnamed protein product [Vicia faba]|uniref:Protein POLLEN DEFECTIVE IN GUIDANCE 1 n=1 Tax=Vicia faba TaxID=3906 RepID=A0AAV1AJL2_VICFA|nr:unnamed protein product [Vicia faba]